jgi:HK97 gp10 family phage protein
MRDPEELYGVAARKRCLEVADQVADEAGRRAPVESGRLRDSLKAVPTAEGAEVFAVDYWKYVEYPTRDTKPQPFIRPAVEIVRARNTR